MAPAATPASRSWSTVSLCLPLTSSSNVDAGTSNLVTTMTLISSSRLERLSGRRPGRNTTPVPVPSPYHPAGPETVPRAGVPDGAPAISCPSAGPTSHLVTVSSAVETTDSGAPPPAADSAQSRVNGVGNHLSDLPDIRAAP